MGRPDPGPFVAELPPVQRLDMDRMAVDSGRSLLAFPDQGRLHNAFLRVSAGSSASGSPRDLSETRRFDQQLAQLLLGCYPPCRAPIPNIECSPKRGFRCRQPPEGCPCQHQVLQ